MSFKEFITDLTRCAVLAALFFGLIALFARAQANTPTLNGFTQLI